MYNPFNYSLDEVKVTVLQLVSVVALLVGFFVVLDPGTEAAWQAVAAAVFGVIGVFSKANPDPEQAEKSLVSLSASVIAVVSLLGGGVADETVERIGLIIAAGVPPFLVFINKNARPV